MTVYVHFGIGGSLSRCSPPPRYLVVVCWGGWLSASTSEISNKINRVLEPALRRETVEYAVTGHGMNTHTIFTLIFFYPLATTIYKAIYGNRAYTNTACLVVGVRGLHIHIH